MTSFSFGTPHYTNAGFRKIHDLLNITLLFNDTLLI